MINGWWWEIMLIWERWKIIRNETGLNWFVEVSNLYRWVGTNRDWSKGKSGGAGFILKHDIRYERVMCDCEDIYFIKIWRVDEKFEWLLGSIYLNCEGVGREENVNKAFMIKAVVNKAKHEGLKILFGGRYGCIYLGVG